MGRGVIGIAAQDDRISLPDTFLRGLGFREGDIVEVRIDGAELRIRRPRYTLESAFGAVPALPGRDTDDFDDLIDEAMLKHADQVVERMRRGDE